MTSQWALSISQFSGLRASHASLAREMQTDSLHGHGQLQTEGSESMSPMQVGSHQQLGDWVGALMMRRFSTSQRKLRV